MAPVPISLADIYACRDKLGGGLVPSPESQAMVTEILGLVTSRHYSRVPHFDGKRTRSSGPHPPFRVTARPSKLGFAKGLDEVRKLFNKLTGSKASTLMPVLAGELDKLRTFADFSEAVVLETVFGIVCSTPFYSRMYAQYYSALASNQQYLTAEIPKQVDRFKELTQSIVAVNPNEDYDGFCAANKLNGRRQALGKFILALCEHGMLDDTVIQQLLSFVLSEFDKLSTVDGKKDECAVLADLCGSLILDNGYVIQRIAHGPLHETIVSTSKLRISDRCSLSNKSIFKFMDIRDHINTYTEGN